MHSYFECANICMIVNLESFSIYMQHMSTYAYIIVGIQCICMFSCTEYWLINFYEVLSIYTFNGCSLAIPHEHFYQMLSFWSMGLVGIFFCIFSIINKMKYTCLMADSHIFWGIQGIKLRRSHLPQRSS